MRGGGFETGRASLRAPAAGIHGLVLLPLNASYEGVGALAQMPRPFPNCPCLFSIRRAGDLIHGVFLLFSFFRLFYVTRGFPGIHRHTRGSNIPNKVFSRRPP